MSSPKKVRKATSTEAGVGLLEPSPASAALTPLDVAARGALLKIVAPSPEPPAREMESPMEASVGSIWQRAQRITALWGKSEERNSWVSVRGVGWKKLSTASDSANIALTALASHALQTGRNVDYREEDDGMIHELYVW